MVLSKDRKIQIGCIIIMVLLVPAVLVYYEYTIAKANNEQIMREHAITQAQNNTSVNGINVKNLPSTSSP